MTRIGDFRRIAGAGSSRGMERLLEHLIAGARLAPDSVVAEAADRGLPVRGRDVYERVFSLRFMPPERLDPLAASYVRSNSLVAGAQGFVTGFGGIATLPVALSADTVGALYWIVRATSGVMNSYGFETETAEGAAQLRVGLLVALGINSVAVEGTRVFVQHASRQLLTTPASQQLLVAGGRHMTRRLASSGVRGRAARAVPLVGGAIGGAINLGMVRTIGQRTRRHYRQLLVEWQANQRGLHGYAPAPQLPRPPPPELEA